MTHSDFLFSELNGSPALAPSGSSLYDASSLLCKILNQWIYMTDHIQSHKDGET